MEAVAKALLTKHLPYLRRYARALAGTQQAADSVVLSTIQSLAGSAAEATNFCSREALYKRFTEIWNGPIGEHIRNLSSNLLPNSSAERGLVSLPALPRQAFLLSVVEEFEDAQICRILDISQGSLPDLMAKARAAIASHVKTDVLIIEDELFIATDLEEIMLGLGHNVIAIERTHHAALKAAVHNRPGLVLADIQLADGSSGIDAVNEILRIWQVPVVFITAYPERLLTGQRPEPAYVLTKPFKADTVRAVVSQALFFDTRATAPGPYSSPGTGSQTSHTRSLATTSAR